MASTVPVALSIATSPPLASDAVDATVTLLAFRRQPRVTRWCILAATVGAAVVSFRVAVDLEAPDPGTTPPGTVPASE